jgi:hypothetical protein
MFTYGQVVKRQYPCQLSQLSENLNSLSEKGATDQEVCLLTTPLATSHSDRSYHIRCNVSSFNPGTSYYRRVSLGWQRPCGESSPCRQVCGHILMTVGEFRMILISFRGHGHVFPPTVRTRPRSFAYKYRNSAWNFAHISACTDLRDKGAILDNDDVSGSGSCITLQTERLVERRV